MYCGTGTPEPKIDKDAAFLVLAVFATGVVVGMALSAAWWRHVK